MSDERATDETTDPTPQEQLDAALDRMHALMPPGQRFQLPPFIEIASGMDALVNLLIEHGVIDEQEFIDRKTLRVAENVNTLADKAAEAKREALGIIIAGADSIPGRGPASLYPPGG